ncbi:hypothetical protein HK107_07830 [Parvularcula sp. ZS-1/3]|uniref:Uncharacterized protein n=1 Tax=Parvularcula mediterranea TaxID=2732508 RepID=A0A7Y3RMY1_9PROT|nr:hypothetical protein [Parvularcula mediterranea]NNU16227.1 hypothetical protein [Parvularcula mediterranea]
MNSRSHTVAVPLASPQVFRHGIRHPDLWLWDAWTYTDESTLHLFCLALARTNSCGQAITPADRNDYPFHVRHFSSGDGGESWRDCGAYLCPDERPGSPTEHNIWSGSALLHGDQLLFGFTGVTKPGVGRSFHQSICLLTSSPEATPDLADTVVLSDPSRDYEAIRKAGYYLGPWSTLGSDGGEEDGPILAWRDPFFVPEDDGTLRAYWAGKVGPAEPAVASGRVRLTDEGYVMDKLYDPIVPPDVSQYTQSEVPKVYRNPRDGSLLMLTSTCNRVSEDQPDEEVSKELRLYQAPGFDGPWTPYAADGATLPGIRHLFGGEFSDVDFVSRRASLIAPYTEMAEPELQLTFADIRKVSLEPENVKKPAPAA